MLPKNAGPSTTPPSGSIFSATNVGILFILLPYMEGDNLRKQFLQIDDNIEGYGMGGMLPPAGRPWYNYTPNLIFAQAKVKYFECPSDTVRNDAPNVGFGAMFVTHCYYTGDPNVNFDSGDPWINGGYYSGTTGKSFGPTNYVAISGGGGNGIIRPGGDPFYAQFIGMFTNRSKLTLGQITVVDGTANTLAFGESLGGRGQGGTRDFFLPWVGHCTMMTGSGLARGNVDHSYHGAQWYNLSSRHASGVQFVFGDGHVATLRFGDTTGFTDPGWMTQSTAYPYNQASHDYRILMQLSGYKDGFQNDTSGLTE
jgi:prepilin-type processing-associated H-X9-DG protein